MLPRSAGDNYVCRTNKQIRGAGSCPTPALSRDAVDREALRLFEDHFLDLEATRERVTAELHARLDEVEAQTRRAGREVAEKTAQLSKIERDYLAGDLAASTFERLTEQVTAERDAAGAEHDRLAANADAVRASRAELDAESAALHRLADLRVSVLNRKRTAEQTADVDALRGAMAQAFPQVYVWPGSTRQGVTLVIDAAAMGTDPVAIPLPPRDTTLTGTGVPL